MQNNVIVYGFQPRQAARGNGRAEGARSGGDSNGSVAGWQQTASCQQVPDVQMNMQELSNAERCEEKPAVLALRPGQVSWRDVEKLVLSSGNGLMRAAEIV